MTHIPVRKQADVSRCTWVDNWQVWQRACRSVSEWWLQCVVCSTQKHSYWTGSRWVRRDRGVLKLLVFRRKLRNWEFWRSAQQCASVCVVESRGSWEPGPEACQPASPQDCTTSTLQHTHRCAEGNGHSDGHEQTRHTDGCRFILEQLPWWVSMISVQTTAVRVSLTWKRLRTERYRLPLQGQSSSSSQTVTDFSSSDGICILCNFKGLLFNFFVFTKVPSQNPQHSVPASECLAEYYEGLSGSTCRHALHTFD